MIRLGLLCLIVGGFALLAACESVIPEPPAAEVIVQGDTIFIVDQIGRVWDITTAVNKYKLSPHFWENGVGLNAIMPLYKPRMISPGDRTYPAPDEDDVIIGTTINGETRAYNLENLNAHEIVIESFGDTHVAVGW